MKIALAQFNYHIGNFQKNTDKIIEGIQKAKSLNADLVVFSELSVCGYPSGDFLEFDDYINKCYQAVELISRHCKGIAAIVGAPARNEQPKGKPLYNAAYFIEDQKIKHVYKKGLLPNYDVFEEYRYFEPATTFSLIEFKNKKIALTICEDLWNLNNNPLYVQNPMGQLAQKGAEVMINIAASPFSWNHNKERKTMLIDNARRYHLPLFYVNHIGAQTELIFDGGSMVINPKGEIKEELSYFEEDFKVVDLDHARKPNPENELPPEDEKHKIENIYNALILGVRDYFGKLGFSKAILGLSGGIDSAVTMAIAAEALGKENVLAVLMPGEFSTDHSLKDAEQLAKNLDSQYHIINIAETHKYFEKNLHPFFENKSFDVTEENIQARTRAIYLMALSNKNGYILLNTSNKSEAAVGYGTLYGDMCGGISVIGDVYKTDVFKLARFINRDKEIIPENTITKPPSAELRPNQKDSDSLPDYEILDKILYEYIENRQGPSEIKESGFDGNLTDRILKLVNTCEYKRFQTPPILRVSSKAFGVGRRMPIVAKYLG